MGDSILSPGDKELPGWKPLTTEQIKLVESYRGSSFNENLGEFLEYYSSETLQNAFVELCVSGATAFAGVVGYYNNHLTGPGLNPLRASKKSFTNPQVGKVQPVELSDLGSGKSEPDSNSDTDSDSDWDKCSVSESNPMYDGITCLKCYKEQDPTFCICIP